MQVLKSINPYTQATINTFPMMDDAAVSAAIECAHDTFLAWRKVSRPQRAKLLKQAAKVLLDKRQEYASHITEEMGKPISEAIAEIEKCAWVCEYYADNAERFLAPKTIKTDADDSFVSYEPIGPVLAVMPWNYPFWQVFRFAAPALMAGNVGMLKHASNVSQCALDIQQVFQLAGFPESAFQSLLVNHQQVEQVLRHPKIKAVTLTGSEQAGRSLAAVAGEEIKKSVLELGGSNAFVVLADANISKAAELAVKARFQNTGQSCIAAKRLIVEASVCDDFVAAFVAQVKQLRTGDPFDEATQVGPLARVDLADKLQQQMSQAVQAGAKIRLGGKQSGAIHEPTVLVDVHPDMRVMQEETFGPLAPIIKADNNDAAIDLAVDSPYGLGVSICTQNLAYVINQLHRFPDGAVFINEMVKSDPRLPFGGTGISGFGRELSIDGMMEFVNKKTVYLKHQIG